jgi:hypothetical protein
MADYRPNTIITNDKTPEMDLPIKKIPKPASERQEGGSHYKGLKIQPGYYNQVNKIGFYEGCVIKRSSRHDKSGGGGAGDIAKAIHELELIMEITYNMTLQEYKDRMDKI